MGSEKTRPDVQTVSDLLGHTNLTTTKKYLYSLKANRRAAVSVLDDIFTQGNDTKSDTKNEKDLGFLLSPYIHGGGAPDRTGDTTDMSRML